MHKTLGALFAVSLTAAAVVVGCGGSPAVTCQTSNCSSGTKSSQVCAKADGSERSTFGAMSRSCPSASSAHVRPAPPRRRAIARAADGGTGGGGSGGGGGGGGSCSATFSGGFTGTSTPCARTVTYVASSDSWTLETAGNTIAGTAHTWTGVSATFSGMPTAGTCIRPHGRHDDVDLRHGIGEFAGRGGGRRQQQHLRRLSATVSSLGASTMAGGGALSNRRTAR